MPVSIEQSGDLNGLLEFISIQVSKGRIDSNTGGTQKRIVKQVFSTIEPEGWATILVKSIDVSDTIKRFGILTGSTFTQASLLTYASRLRRAFRWYLMFLDGEDWLSEINRPADRKQKMSTKPDPKKTDSKANYPVPQQQAGRDLGKESAQRINHSILLPSGEFADVIIPANLTAIDAKRLIRAIRGLSMDELED